MVLLENKTEPITLTEAREILQKAVDENAGTHYINNLLII